MVMRYILGMASHWVYISKPLTLFSIDGKVLAEELQRVLGPGHQQSVQHALVQCKDALFLCIVGELWRNRQLLHSASYSG